MLDDQLAVADVLTSLQPPLAQPYPGLQLVIEDPLLTEQEEKVLLVALAGLTLHVPVVLPGHLVLVFLKQYLNMLEILIGDSQLALSKIVPAFYSKIQITVLSCKKVNLLSSQKMSLEVRS